MQLTDVPIELTTAITDALLAVLSLAVVRSLWRWRRAHPLKAWLWIGMFIGLILASGFGALAHGLKLDDATRRLIWRPLNAALGFTIACTVAGAVLDLWGSSSARRSFPGLLMLSAGFFLYATFASRSFLAFIIYEGIAMLFCSAIYAILTVRRCLPGAAWMLTGVLLTIAAATLQVVHSISFTLFLPFNYNGAFHLMQMIAIACLWTGLSQACTPSSAAVSEDWARTERSHSLQLGK